MTNRCAKLAAIVIALFCAHLRAADESKLSVEAVGVRVARGNSLKEKMIWPTGTSVSLLVSSRAGEFIHFDAVDSAVAKFVDDKGTDLQARPKDAAEPALPAAFGTGSKIDKDAKSCLIEFSAPGLPVKGATQLILQGTLSMLCATTKKETEVKNVPIRSGTRIAGPGNLELQIEQVGKPEFGKGAWAFLLRAQRELDDLAEVKFFRTDGTEIPSTRTTTSTLAIEGAVRVEWNYALSERVDAANVKLYTWSDAQKKRIKVDLKIDLGL
ncbi:MAG TPA: hypothetical protein VKX17_03095 [Planctomycetota bacterium]|nr:hypothetical protein [Planctomycetota bacterium]